MKKLAAVFCAIFIFTCAAAQSYEFSYYQEFDKDGRVTYEKDAYGYEAQGVYDKTGKQIYYKSTVNGELDAEGWFTYYSNGEFKSCHVIDGLEEWLYLYDKNGNLTHIEMPSGNIYTYYYDSLGRNIYACSQDGEKMFFAYTDDAVFATYSFNGNKIFYTYDSEGNLVSSYSTEDEKFTSYKDDYVYPSDDSDYDYSSDDEYDEYNEADYDWDDLFGYEDEDDDYTEEYDKYGNITLRTTRYYSEKYEYTYYRDGTVKTVTCYNKVFDSFIE